MKSLKTSLLPVIFFLLQINAHSTIRYVKAGNPAPVPPYTSWATASDSIQKCINISSPGDTIYLSDGTYYEQIVMIPKLTIIGSGWENCILDASRIVPAITNNYSAVRMKDSSMLLNFQIDIKYNWISPKMETGIFSEGGYTQRLEAMKIVNTLEAIWIRTGIVKNCIIYNTENVFFSDATNPNDSVVFIENIVTKFGRKLYYPYSFGSYNTRVIFRNNIFYPRESAAQFVEFLTTGPDINSTLYFINNIIFSGQSDPFENMIKANWTSSIENNVFLINSKYVVRSTGSTFVKNNHISNVDVAVDYRGGTLEVKSNNFQNVKQRYLNYTNPDDSLNIEQYPMFVKDGISPLSGGDYHLQKYSPLIDAGDPEILDKDGTRSDIGAYGGPWGEVYAYNDLAPLPPAGLTLTILRDTQAVKLNWKRNRESDFSNYLIYSDSIPAFNADSSRLISSTQDTSYLFTREMITTSARYFKLGAVDNQGNISETGNEVGIVLSESREMRYPETQNRLFQNYPNPFGKRTVIGYSISTPSTVRINIYDINGEKVSALYEGEREAGCYEEEFPKEGEGAKLKSGIYVCKIDVIEKGSGKPAYFDLIKMVKIK